MKKFNLPILFSLVWVALSGGAYGGTQTDTLDVNVTSVAACAMVVTGINFPDYDGTTSVSANGQITVTCPMDLMYFITLDAGQNFNGQLRNVSAGAYLLTYRLGHSLTGNEWGDSGFASTYPQGSAVTNTGNGTPQLHLVDGYLSGGQAVPAGLLFTDTVAVTLHY